MKRTSIWTMLLVVVCITGILLTYQPAQAQSQVRFEYGMTDGGMEIFGASEESGVLTIPSFWKGSKVVAIGESAFYGRQGLTGVVVSQGITRIDSYAFCECSGLTSVTLPDSLKSLGYGSFSDCSQLNFTLYKNGKYLGSDNNPYLALVEPVSDTADVTVHKDTKVISESMAYLQNVKLQVEAGNPCFSADSAGVLFNADKSVLLWAPKHLSGSYTVPDGVAQICDSAFNRSEGLTAITLADSVKTIGSYAFSGLSSLKTLTLGEQLEFVGDYAVAYCDALTYKTYENATYLGSAKNPYLLLVDVVDHAAAQFQFHKDTRVIGSSAFSGCSALTELTVPDGVVGIGDHAFWSCSALTTLRVGKDVRYIGERLTSSCYQLRQILVDSGNSAYSSYDGVLLNKDKTCLLQAPEGIEGEYTVPDSVRKIEKEAFFACSQLTGVAFGKGLEEIGEDAFYECEKLTQLTVPGSVQTIGPYAFYGCTGLTDVRLGEGVVTVDSRAFYCCRALASVTLPDSLQTIGWEAFASSYQLTEVTIPKNVSTVGDSAFGYCPALTQILVAQENPHYRSVDGVLYNKAQTLLIQAPGSIAACVVPQGVQTIGESAFLECKKLKSVILPDSVTTIENGAFCDSRLESILIPQSVTQMGESAFRGIRNIRFLGDMPAVMGSWKAITSDYGSKVNVYYPENNATWNDEAARAALCESANWRISNQYPVTEGADSVITPEAPALAVATEADSSQFLGLYLDGKWIAPENYTLDGDMQLTLTEAYQQTLKSGSHTLTLAFADGQASAALTVKKDLTGDLNGQNDVDEDDAIYLLQHVMMPELFPVDQAVDYNKDGSVNQDDAIYLLQHVMMPELFPLQ